MHLSQLISECVLRHPQLFFSSVRFSLEGNGNSHRKPSVVGCLNTTRPSSNGCSLLEPSPASWNKNLLKVQRCCCFCGTIRLGPVPIRRCSRWAGDEISHINCKSHFISLCLSNQIVELDAKEHCTVVWIPQMSWRDAVTKDICNIITLILCLSGCRHCCALSFLWEQ